MAEQQTNLQPLIKKEKGFQVLDQKKLPVHFEYIDVNNIQDTFRVIREMNVRGAPFIAVVALYGLQVEVEIQLSNLKTVTEFKKFVHEKIEYIKDSRPTAVNLFNDTKYIAEFTQNLDDQLSVQQCYEKLSYEINKIDLDYVKASDDMANVGYEKVLVDVPKIKDQKINVLTICNTGKLAVPGIGTALGLVRKIYKENKLNMVYVAETRPYLQGSRLTASEVVADNMPGTLITDSMAGILMRDEKIDLVVIGADRVANNGDTANKIGSYTFSVLAKQHNVPFYTVLPDSTIDRQCVNGRGITIEQRPSEELIKINGIQIAPSNINVYNPCFDVTPSQNITRIITEKGEFEVDRETGEWEIMDSQKLAVYLKQKKQFEENDTIEIQEVGDGNLNLVFIATSKNTGKQLICKQALPYVRCVGPEWPFPLSRAYYESKALAFHNKYAQEYCPKLIDFDKKLALITMEYLQPPYIIQRKGLIQQVQYKNAANHVGQFCAQTLFFSSGLHLNNDNLRQKMQFWCGNTSLCSLTEQVIFLDPYYDAQYNKHTTPQLDDISKQFQNDEELLFAVTQLRNKFIHNKQALIHGDLHSGSVMVTEEFTKVIDPEFAFYGPMGFDLGAFIANLLLNFFSQRSKLSESQKEQTLKYKEYILNQISTFWEVFQKQFLELWENKQNYEESCAYPQQYLNKSVQFANKIRYSYLEQLFEDSIGFAAAKMIRRILGIAHVEDMESIESPDQRADCEKRALLFARQVMVNAKKYTTINDLIKEANTYFDKQL